jgi:hypothetical protein
MSASRKQQWATALKGRTKSVHQLVLLGVGLVLVASVAYAAYLSRPKANHPSVSGNVLPAKPPSTLAELLTLPSQKLEGTDIALMNLLCAEGLPGAEHLNVPGSLAVLDQWAQHAQREIERNRHRFRDDPAYFYHSESFYQMLMLAVVVYEDFQVRYNPKWMTAPAELTGPDHFFADSRDLFVHGMLPALPASGHPLPAKRGEGRGEGLGTCSSLPVLYLALGRRLGYPLKLVTTRQHLFLRWDSPTEKFNLEATGKGMDRYEDAHYRQWPFPITEQEIKEQDYLKSLSPREELSVFLSLRGACLTEAGRLAEATETYEAAYRYAPNWKGNQVLLAEARQRQAMLAARRPPVIGATPTVPAAFEPLRQTPNPKRKP